MKKQQRTSIIDRRQFLKVLGVGAGATASGSLLSGCGRNSNDKTDENNLPKTPVPTDKMTYRYTKRTNDKVSLLGYGCMRWPTVTNSKGDDEIDQEAVNQLIDYAIAHGVNYFDVAPPYMQGKAETATGIALKRHPRNKFFIATKLSSHHSDIPNILTREGSISMYKHSFETLQVDYFDYYLLHSVGTGGFDLLKQRFFDNHVLDFLVQERGAGRIRNLGFSYHGDIKAFDYLLSINDDIKWDFVQIQLNYVDWKHAEEMNARNKNAEYLYNELLKRDIPAVIMEPLLGGRLSRLNPYSLALLKKAHPNESPASWAFRYAGSFPNVLTVLSGMTYMEHLQDNIRTYSPLVPLKEDDYKLLETIALELSRSEMIPCTACKYCMPCPYGLDIPEIFAHYNRCVNDKMLPKSTTDANYRKARQEFLYGFDRSVPKLRQANHCIGCKLCEEKCPQRIKIADEMKMIDKLTEQLKQGTL